jgi:hypothetical protein
MSHASSTATLASGGQSAMRKVFDTMREPGASARNFGRSCSRLLGSRNSAITVAREMSAWYMSPRSNVARPVTPASSALRRDSSTMSGLYSTPSARAPRLAAPITFRPSPEPRSMTKSFGPTFARSSIFSTSAAGVGTHTTSLPACPTSGVNGWARCAEVPAETSSAAIRARVHTRAMARMVVERAVAPLGLEP